MGRGGGLRMETLRTIKQETGRLRRQQRLRVRDPRFSSSVTRDPIVPSGSPELLLIAVSWPISSSSYPQCRAHAATRVVSVFPVGRDKASVGPLTHAPNVFIGTAAFVLGRYGGQARPTGRVDADS